MYYSMQGRIEGIKADRLIVSVGPIAYEILISHPEEFNLHEDALLYLYELIREDEHSLIGFRTLEEKAVFLSLISVKGIGPKTALNALSATDAASFIEAVETNHQAFLKKLPGIGAKAAQQIVLDLRGHLSLNEQTTTSKSERVEFSEVRTALKSLGFKATDIDRVLATFDDHHQETTESLLRQALVMLRKV